MKEAVIVALGRSAIGKAPRGILRSTRPENAAAQVLLGVLDQVPGLNRQEIEDLIVGCAFPEAEQGTNIAKIIATAAGLPDAVPGQTVNRFCSSGLQTIATAANAIMAGQAECIVAGGVEFMSAIPMGGNTKLPNPYVMAHDARVYTSMGITAENVATKYGVTREMQDTFALRSHKLAAKARAEGKFQEEIIPVQAAYASADDGGWRTKYQIFDRDEGIRENITPEGLAKLNPVFQRGGSVTAGNASQTSDGAAMVVLMSREKAERLHIKPLAQFIGFAVAGVPADYMGIGPIAAIPKVLKLTGLQKENMDVIELNEAFASQALACVQELDLDKDRVNVNGGAIAMGHPLGATGAILTTKLVRELHRRSGTYGMVSMCIGGGMGAAGIFKRL